MAQSPLYKPNPRTWRNDFPESANPLRFFFFISRPHWRPAIVAISSVVVGASLFTGIAYVFKLITNAVTAIGSGGSFADLVVAVAMYVVVLFIAQTFVRLSGFSGAMWATGARATARYALTAYVTLHGRKYFSERFAGSVANKISHAGNGARQMVQHVVWQFTELVVSIFVSFGIAYLVSPTIAWIFSIWVIVAFLVNTYFSYRRIPLSSHAQRLETTLTGATVDLLSNIMTMQEYARRLFEIERIKSMTEERRQAGLRNWHYGEKVLLLNGILQMVFGGAMAFAAVHFAYIGQISAGDIIMILALIFRIEGLLLFLGSHLNEFAETWGEISESLDEILEPHEIPDQAGAAELQLKDTSISIHNMTFGFSEQPIFKELSLHILAGQRVGLVGKSGAGKSTLMRLILHHHELNAGTIEIGGTNIALVTQESLRRAIGIVPQEPLLFHRSVSENIAYGKPDATQQEIEHAAQLAQAHDFIQRLPKRYGALVGERGVKLSGGERQRVAIARAIIKNAPILLLDEATSALDSESEVEIQKALHELMKGKTVIAIAHRLSTLREMDRILVMDQGKIVEEGTHDQLVAGSGIYSQLWRHQAGGFIQDT